MQLRIYRLAANLVVLSNNADRVRLVERRTDRRFVGAEVNSGSQRDKHRTIGLDEMVAHNRRVLREGHEKPLLQHDVVRAVAPDREAILETELLDERCAFEVQL